MWSQSVRHRSILVGTLAAGVDISYVAPRRSSFVLCGSCRLRYRPLTTASRWHATWNPSHESTGHHSTTLIRPQPGDRWAPPPILGEVVFHGIPRLPQLRLRSTRGCTEVLFRLSKQQFSPNLCFPRLSGCQILRAWCAKSLCSAWLPHLSGVILSAIWNFSFKVSPATSGGSAFFNFLSKCSAFLEVRRWRAEED